MIRRMITLIGALALLAGACSEGTGGDASGPEVETTDTATDDTAAPESDDNAAPDPAADDGAEVAIDDTYEVPDYLAQLGDFVDAPDDRSLPPIDPDGPTGSYGFSRYVYNQVGDDVIPTLVEGPRGLQYRCQELERECSYTELQALLDSGAEIPDYLGMTHDELTELVAQLGEVNAAIEEYPTLEEACAAGFRLSSSQNANMGIHVQNPNGTSIEFDPGRPQMVLYAKEGGEQLTQAEQGNCVDGAWTGEPGYESVGAVFTLVLTPEHPDGFAGPIDNWHVHFNTCAGNPEEGGVDGSEEANNAGTFSEQQCEAQGGNFMDVIPVWMMHAYVEPENDPQGGVFAMFNPNIWPIAETVDDIETLRTASLAGTVAAPINNFDFGTITAEVGEPIVFSNSDSVPHTVTAGSPASPRNLFDSGLLGTGESFELAFDEPGAYALFCVLHPTMTTTVTVE